MSNNQKLITGTLIISTIAVFLFGGWWMGSQMWGTGMMYGWGGMGIGMAFFWYLFIAGLFLLFSDRYQRARARRSESRHPSVKRRVLPSALPE